MSFDAIYEAAAIGFQKGGNFMYAIGAIGVLALAIAIHKFLKLEFIMSVNSPSFMKQVIKLVSANNIERAVKVCKVKRSAALPQVIVAGLLRNGKPLEDIQGAMDEAALKAIPEVQSGISYLAMFANVATLLGLLGTIAGLISAFSAVAVADPSQKQQLLAKGISEAMYTTAFGLIVAIPCMMIHSYLANKATKIVDDIEMFSVAVVNVLSEQYRTVRHKIAPGVPAPPPSSGGIPRGV
ncbi:MAG: MotA/TolQ/ExbB proton channel family protein [Oligoflexia bacterium]|nr:MotA/TolQ/ExbB proton channel family protein [Oligoflexia bacterium]